MPIVSKTVNQAVPDPVSHASNANRVIPVSLANNVNPVDRAKTVSHAHHVNLANLVSAVLAMLLPKPASQVDLSHG